MFSINTAPDCHIAKQMQNSQRKQNTWYKAMIIDEAFFRQQSNETHSWTPVDDRFRSPTKPLQQPQWGESQQINFINNEQECKLAELEVHYENVCSHLMLYSHYMSMIMSTHVTPYYFLFIFGQMSGLAGLCQYSAGFSSPWQLPNLPFKRTMQEIDIFFWHN